MIPPRPRPTRRAVLGALPLAPWIAGCHGRPDPPRGRGVLVLVLDALRYDRTSFAPGGPDTTPRLAKWAREGAFQFDDCWSVAPSLVPAHVALLTGCDPWIARTPRVVLSDGRVVEPVTPWTIPEGAPSLAEEFLKEGWTTGAFIDHRFPILRGLERGFVVFDSFGGGSNQSGLANVCYRFYEWLGELDEDADWFAYVHLNDLEVVWDEADWARSDHPELVLRDPRPELDWVPPVGAQTPVFHALPPGRVLEGQPPLGTYEARYDAALAWLDGNLVRLFGMLGDLGRLERTTIAVQGSHGLSFGESGLYVSSGIPCDVDLHVPMLLRPGSQLGFGAPLRQDALTSSLDLAPTLLQLSDIPIPRGMHGQSLVPLLRGTATRVRDHAFGCHGEIDGFCAVTESQTYLALQPGARRASMASSWFGDDRRRHAEEIRFLAERRGGPGRGLGIPELSEGDERGRDLDVAARAWYADLESAREVLHPSDWNADKRGQALIAELRRKGLIGG